MEATAQMTVEEKRDMLLEVLGVTDLSDIRL